MLYKSSHQWLLVEGNNPQGLKPVPFNCVGGRLVQARMLQSVAELITAETKTQRPAIQHLLSHRPLCRTLIQIEPARTKVDLIVQLSTSR